MTTAEGASLLACVIKCRISGINEEYSSCGTLILPKQGLVISHGSLLTDLCIEKKELLTKISNGQLIDGPCLEKCKFSVLLDKRWDSRYDDQKTLQIEAHVTSQAQKGYHKRVPSFHSLESEFLGAFRNNHFHDAMNSLMPKSNWKITDGSSELSNEKKNTNSHIEANVMFQLASYFLIFKIDPVFLSFDTNGKLSDLLVSARTDCFPGDIAELISTPFGGLSPGVFFNSFSTGVISNVSGQENCWILTDARCIPGSEGAPLFSKLNESCSGRYLTGIIAVSLCWKNNEWIGFSVACSVNSILHSLINISYIKSVLDEESLTIKLLSNTSNICDEENWLLSSTVLIQVGSTWGSGVIVDNKEGLILTCSHVVIDANFDTVLISLSPDGQQYKADVIYRQDPLTGPLDVAVLKCQGVDMDQVKVPPFDAVDIGDHVYAVGHAVFGKNCRLKPSISSGVISKVLKSEGKPVMIQSTCAVHPGASGGPLLSKAGKLVGILVCNTKDHGTRTSYPHVNMSVPSGPIWSSIKEFKHTKDKNCFNKLQLNSPYIKELWNLGNSTKDSQIGSSKL